MGSYTRGKPTTGRNPQWGATGTAQLGYGEPGSGGGEACLSIGDDTGPSKYKLQPARGKVTGVHGTGMLAYPGDLAVGYWAKILATPRHKVHLDG